MPKMSYTDADIQATQDLIGTLQNLEPDSPLVTLGNAQNEALRYLAKIFDKSTSPARPPKLLHLEQHQTIVETFPNKHAEPTRVPIVDAYP